MNSFLILFYNLRICLQSILFRCRFPHTCCTRSSSTHLEFHYPRNTEGTIPTSYHAVPQFQKNYTHYYYYYYYYYIITYNDVESYGSKTLQRTWISYSATCLDWPRTTANVFIVFSHAIGRYTNGDSLEIK